MDDLESPRETDTPRSERVALRNAHRIAPININNALVRALACNVQLCWGEMSPPALINIVRFCIMQNAQQTKLNIHNYAAKRGRCG